jgi:hypothetical protein
MRNQLRTAFWKNALKQLPAGVQARHVHDFEAAERWELRLAALIEAWSQLKSVCGRMFHQPRSAH